MDNTFERISSSEEETDDSNEESGDEIKNIIHYEHFMNQQKKSEYEKNRNRLFTKDLVRKTIVIDSHNYFQPENFSTSNFNVLFDFENSTGNSTVTTNYDIYKNVIGFRLISTTIRTPPFNVNDTNNIIIFVFNLNKRKKDLRNLVDKGKKELGEGIVIVFAIKEGKIGLAVGVTNKLIKKYDAVKFVKIGSEIVGGKGGGGRPDFAQAGGVEEKMIDEAFDKIKSLV